MDNSKRARSEKSRILPRAGSYVAPADLQSALRRIRQAACRDTFRILNSVCASLPEVRALCGSSARRDLCGGRRVTGVPTATATHSADHHDAGPIGGIGCLKQS
jgi:hypothetical protein